MTSMTSMTPVVAVIPMTGRGPGVPVREEPGHRLKERATEEGDQWSLSRADRALPPVCRYGDGGSCGSCCGGGTHWGSRTCGRATGHGYDPCRVPRAPYVRQVSGPARGDGCGHGSAAGTAGGTAVPVVMPSTAGTAAAPPPQPPPPPSGAAPGRPAAAPPPGSPVRHLQRAVRPPSTRSRPSPGAASGAPLPARADLSPRSWSVRPERPSAVPPASAVASAVTSAIAFAVPWPGDPEWPRPRTDGPYAGSRAVRPHSG